MDALLLLLKATLLLSLPILAARLLRRAPAAVRHGLWTLTFAAVLALPFLSSALPALSVPVPAGWAAAMTMMGGAPAASTTPTTPTTLETTGDVRATQQSYAEAATRAPRIERSDVGVGVGLGAARESSATRRGWPTTRVMLSALWLGGTIAAMTVLMLSLMRVRRLARTAEDLTDPEWRQAADAIGARLGLRRPARLLASARVGTPMAAGVWRPLIFVPATAREWSAECRDVVLAHEMAHLAVRDPLRHLTARLAVACYWFHPLAWVGARQATIAREQACDEAVLALGTRPSAYAQVLLDLADSMTLATPAPALGALPMIERSLLERRLMAILNADVRPGAGRRVLIPAIGVAALMLSVALARPVARDSSSPSSPSSPSSTSSPSSSSSSASARSASSAPPASARSSVAALRAAGSAAQADSGESPCAWNVYRGRSFNGNMSTTTDASGREVIREMIGRTDGHRVIMTVVGDLRLCMVTDDVTEGWDPPSDWLDGTARVVMQAQRGNAIQRLDLQRQFGGGERISWRVGGTERPFDAAAQQWRDRMLDTLDAVWELHKLRSRESTLRGEISTIYGEESTLRGRISTLQGEVSTMQGRISTIQGEESTLRGQISSIQGHLSTLQGAISSEQGAISSLQSLRYNESTAAQRARATERIAQHEAAIKDVERQIREYDATARVAAVERQIDAHNTRRKVAEIEAQIRAFDLPTKVAAIERQITALDVRGKVSAIERQITALDTERRSRELLQQRDATLERLESALGVIR